MLVRGLHSLFPDLRGAFLRAGGQDDLLRPYKPGLFRGREPVGTYSCGRTIIPAVDRPRDGSLQEKAAVPEASERTEMDWQT